MDASEIYSKRLNAKEVIFPKENGKFIFPVADGRINLPGGDEDLRTSTSITQFKDKVTLIFLENQKGLFHHLKTRFRMPVKAINDSWSMSGNVIYRHDVESNFTRREKNHSLFH